MLRTRIRFPYALRIAAGDESAIGQIPSEINKLYYPALREARAARPSK